ncbi:MAG: septal ring lytic transglycosylase RlpA family protein [Methylococcaceae bacterium]|jgi:rare lipoprotein A
MNKIIFLAYFFALCSCSTGQIKTSEASHEQTNVASKHKPSCSIDEEDNQFGVDALLSPSYVLSDQSEEQENLLPHIDSFLKQGLKSKQGIASWYGPEFHGKKTAGGEIFDMYAMTAASKTLPIASYARVTNLENQRSVIVRINDKGPFHGNRVMDLSYSAAKKIGIHESGTGMVKITAIPQEQALPMLQASAARQAKHVFLQVGAFKNKHQAEKLQSIIASHQLPEPKILASTYKKASIYKVQMGPIPPSENAKVLSEQLAQIGITETQFVTETRQN